MPRFIRRVDLGKNNSQKMEDVFRLKTQNALILETPCRSLARDALVEDDSAFVRHPFWQVCVIAVKSDVCVEASDRLKSARADERVAAESNAGFYF